MSARALKDRSAEDLIETYESYHDAIYGVNKCYGTKDLINKDNIEAELIKRGYALRTNPVWEKVEEEEEE